MVDLVEELLRIVDGAEPRLRAVSDDRAAARLAPDRWSAKEVLGHLIDSAANNHRRFVEAQLKDDLVFPGYDQEQWVTVQHYQEEAWPRLVTLWAAYNRYLARVVASIPAAQLTLPRTRHTLDRIAWQLVSADTPTTLEYLIRDYAGHLQDHVNQILEMVKG
jgi:hypothetical protein